MTPTQWTFALIVEGVKAGSGLSRAAARVELASRRGAARREHFSCSMSPLICSSVRYPVLTTRLPRVLKFYTCLVIGECLTVDRVASEPLDGRRPAATLEP